MDSMLDEPQSTQKFKDFIGRNYETALNQSFQALLDSFHDSDSEKLSLFTQNFNDLLQCKINPPLETIWVCSALAFRSRNLPKNEPLNQFTAIKDLFQLVVSYSASCNSVKNIVLIAPLVYHLHKFIVELKGYELRSKKEKKLMKEIRGLVDSILAYVNVCCEDLEGDFDSLEGLIRPLKDLVSVWIWDEKEKSGEIKERLKLFFPLLGDELVEKVSVGGWGLSELAGFVIAEVFLLKLCLTFRGEVSGKELQNELRTWVVGSITGLRNSYFFDYLVRMLLEPSLPVTSILSSEDEASLRKVLYETVILVEYSFLNPERLAHMPAKHVKGIALGRLMVTLEAVEFFRKHGYQAKALSCTKAFSSCSLPCQIIRWVRSEVDFKDNFDEPNGSSPKAFLRWILNIENRGIQVFDDDMSTYRAKLVLNNTEEDSKLSDHKENKKADADVLFYIDKKGEQEDENEKDEEMTEAVSAAFVAAAHSLQSAEHGGRKRKAGNNEKKNRHKFLKYDLYEDSAPSAEKATFVDNSGFSSGSDIENPSSDEEDN